MSQLVGVLSACPLLRSLGLQDALPQALNAPIAHLDQTLQAVHLSNLVIVELRGMPHECEHFLSRIIFPAYSNLMLDGWTGRLEDAHNPEAEFSALLNLHKNRAYSSTAEDFSSSFLWFHYLPDELEVIVANVNTRIALPRTPLDHRIVTNFARQFFAFTPLAECISLSIGFEDDIPFSQEELLDIFAHDYLHCIDEVTWGGSEIGIAAFCAALSACGEALSANPASSPGFLVFPHLKTLGISYVDFSDPSDREILWTSSVGLQADHKARGSPIQKLVFTACRGLSEEWTDALQSSSIFEETEVQFHSR
ncbi:hypothetical protein EWM64_g4242 [Hericium alpestre]|uniref:F-box domain-containing protein n=1 Tax=Hericium alpestre TaxID=135208 RepID=A0A4Z0A0Q2_9AGAM|nr:hypothetical protein EWM64_g4242 [Hericium alpestre]